MQMINLYSYAGDYYRFRKDNALFIPKIAETVADFDPTLGYNGAIVELDARLDSDLDWSSALAEAADLPLVVWKFNFGLEEGLANEMAFNSYRLALDHFTKTFWPEVQAKTFGVILFEGNADLTATFNWNEDLKESYEDFLIEYPLSSDRALRYFCLRTVMDYLHQLVTILPDELLLFAQFDARSLSCPVETAQLFSKEIFSHIHPAIRAGRLPQFGLRWREGATRGGYIGVGPVPSDVGPFDTSIGFILPESPTESVVLKEAIMASPEEYRLIDEAVLAESWDELEEIIYIEELLTVLGKRKLRAFEAAGGKLRGRGI